MLPYLKKAKEEGYGVIILNPNTNGVKVKVTKKVKGKNGKQGELSKGFRFLHLAKLTKPVIMVS